MRPIKQDCIHQLQALAYERWGQSPSIQAYKLNLTFTAFIGLNCSTEKNGAGGSEQHFFSLAYSVSNASMFSQPHTVLDVKWTFHLLRGHWYTRILEIQELDKKDDDLCHEENSISQPLLHCITAMCSSICEFPRSFTWGVITQGHTPGDQSEERFFSF